jgi:type II secretory ATPase GspE/PulE/Tfp pilus assembly ATPase PilB-like protein
MFMTSRDEESVVALVDALIERAVLSGASDIHIEPYRTEAKIRYRHDGVLHDQNPIPHRCVQQVIARCKVLGSMNIAERRIPQDGKFNKNIKGHHIDFRVSTFPGMYGEKVVIRILDRSHNMITLDHVGLSPALCASFRALLNKPSGFLLVAGPTGSGKTTTLYAGLAELNNHERNIITLEDPVEYDLPGITQGQIRPDVGFTFEKGIRAILRQDPDIIMIGEMRDTQTAQIAIQAALTGHGVLSTVHTNDAASVIMRLIDMGIEPFLINAAVSGVLAQRLARKICPACRTPYEPSADERTMLARLGSSLTTLSKGAGCVACDGHGYKGRVGIFELLVIDAGLRSLIMRDPSHDVIAEYAHSHGFQSLLNDGLSKVGQGVISLQELMRVV